jgi:hypothetical protein
MIFVTFYLTPLVCGAFSGIYDYPTVSLSVKTKILMQNSTAEVRAHVFMLKGCVCGGNM